MHPLLRRKQAGITYAGDAQGLPRFGYLTVIASSSNLITSFVEEWPPHEVDSITLLGRSKKMSMPPEQIEIKCPKCHTRFKTWHRPSMNLGLDHFSDAYIRKMSTAVCPECKFRMDLDSLIVAEDGTWQIGKVQRKRKDGQKSGLSGELFVAAELLKRDFQVSLTLGTAKAIDLFALNEESGVTYKVQVKTLRASNCYLINAEDIDPSLVYAFVLLHKVGQNVDYFLISGQELIEKEKDIWGSGGGRIPMAGITMGGIKPYKDNWGVFEK